MPEHRRPWKRRRRYLVHGRRRVPFDGYQRRKAAAYPADVEGYPVSTFGPQHGLTPSQVWEAEKLLAKVLEHRREYGLPVKGPWWPAIIAGVVSAIRRGAVGNHELGCRMRRQKGARMTARNYPGLVREWARNANRARWDKPLKPVPLADTSEAKASRERRALKRARAAYEGRQLPTAPAKSWLAL